MLKNDLWINQKGIKEVFPFQSNLVRHLEPDNQRKPVLSYGCSSYGYDLRLSSKEFLIFNIFLDQSESQKFNPKNLEKTVLHHDDDGDFYTSAHSYGLGVALEKMKASENIS